MQSSMTLGSMAALFGIMLAGALIPGVSSLAAAARSAASGFIHGVFTTLGIVLGDIIFILLAIFGLSILAETMGHLFVLVKYLGGVYLVWLGIVLWRSRSTAAEATGIVESSLLSSFLTGLIITLGDQKAILFYLVLFPAFFDLPRISYWDAGIIILIAIIAVGGGKLGYAFLAHRASLFFKSVNAVKKINMVAGSVMMAVGVFLVAKA